MINKEISNPLKILRGFFLKHPLFEDLSDLEIDELAALFHKRTYSKNEILVKENDLVDSVYVLIEGKTEVTKDDVVLATLHPGETVGLNDTGFFSKTGLRTATVKALTQVVAYQMDLISFQKFLERHPDVISEQSKKLLRLNFIKQVEPFQELEPILVSEIAEGIEELKVPDGHLFFKEGDLPDSCYLLTLGKVAVSQIREKEEVTIEELEPISLFGELGLLTGSTRNATVRAMGPCEVLVLKQSDLQKLISHTKNLEPFISTMLFRMRLKPVQGITTHKRVDSKGNTIVILKNDKEGRYFKTSVEGLFIWSQLDGEKTLKEISVAFFFEFHKLIIEDIDFFILRLINSGFIDMPFITTFGQRQSSRWQKFMVWMTKIMTKEYAIKNVDVWLTKCYNHFGYLFYTLPAQILMALVAIVGFIFFILLGTKTENAITLIHHAWTLLIYANLTTLLFVPLHEFAHAMTTKAYGYKVHRLGVGWFWISAIAFADTSDMWLASRGKRIVVNLAGIYVNVIAGSVLAIIAACTGSTISAFFWLAALFNYLIAFYNLEPIIELDGYYILMDAFDTSNLRAKAAKWIIENRKFCIDNIAEISYWIACIIFILASAALGYFLQNHVFSAFLPQDARHFSTSYLRYVLFILVIALSFWSLYSKAKKIRS